MAAKKPMSAKTKALLLDTDLMSTRSLTLTPKARQCHTCRAWTWAGLADIGPYAGVHLTWTPTTSFGEMLALTANIPTYQIESARIERRTAYSIARYPADTVRTHPLHMCNGPPLPINPAWNKRPPSKTFEWPQEIPY